VKLHREITRLVLSFLGALATVALLFAFSFTEPAGASTVSSVTFWPTTTAAGISSSWDVGFKTTAALPSGKQIYMLSQFECVSYSVIANFHGRVGFYWHVHHVNNAEQRR